PLRGFAYLAEPEGSIEAVNLATGETLWTSRSASLPIGANDSYVAAQEEQSTPGTFAVVFLDIRNGSAVSRAVIPLPAPVHSMVGVSQVSGFFLATAKATGNDIDVSWYYDDRVYFGAYTGLPPTMYTGNARVDPRTGTIVAIDPGVVVTDYPSWFTTYGANPAPPWRSGNVFASPSVGSDGSITLKRTSIFNGQPLPDVLLSSHANFATSSVDSRNVFVEESSGGGSYRIRIFETETGAAVGDYLAAPLAGFVVFNGSIITTKQSYGFYAGVPTFLPATLAAFLLPTGAPVWSVTRRDPDTDAAPPKTGPPLRRAVRH
ncbi:MAG TPA: hypothetical protein VHU41_15960, partial [Thermoanaerobaculia bacterium]|nr:hypothetical protein [Thermoanaerobaculia bacterium]